MMVVPGRHFSRVKKIPHFQKFTENNQCSLFIYLAKLKDNNIVLNSNIYHLNWLGAT